MHVQRHSNVKILINIVLHVGKKRCKPHSVKTSFQAPDSGPGNLSFKTVGCDGVASSTSPSR
uniref:Uncharacterized protein n=1 Tax=Anguilla anguilla TaxID=7936 RepID=A0A0E9PL30_ANGAN